jgi:hypothetical protein
MDEELSTEGVRNPMHTSLISDGYAVQGQIAHICTRYALDTETPAQLGLNWEVPLR